MSLTSILTATTRTSAERFATMVDNLAAAEVGAERSFGAGAAHIEMWRPVAGTWVLHLVEWDEELANVSYLRTVSVVTQEDGRFSVLTGNGSHALADDFRQVEAALGYALDYVTAPVWGAGAQDACPAV